MRVDKVPRWLPGGGGYLHRRGLPASPALLTEPWWPVIRASADQARLGRAGGKGSRGHDPTAMSTSSTGTSASRRPERTPAECPYQHACERGAGSCLTPGLVLKRLRNWDQEDPAPFTAPGRGSGPACSPRSRCWATASLSPPKLPCSPSDRWVASSSRSVSTQEVQRLSSQEGAGTGSLGSCCFSVLPSFLQKSHPSPEEALKQSR